MTCAAFAEMLSDWLDGALPEERARAMREHAEGCEACRALERDVRAVVAGLGDLPREDEASPGTWASIEDRIRGERRGGSARTWWLSVAAAIVLVVVGGVIATRRTPDRERAPAPPMAEGPSLPPALASADATLLEARAALDEVLAARRTKLSPETVRALTTSLAEMERATREIRDALAKDPDSRDLQQMLVASHRRQLSVMRDVTLLAARQDRTSYQETPR
jgi:predicted anti-sigma-YlaC factor YlaD